MIPTIRARFTRRCPLSDLKEFTIMFQTLILQYLNKLGEGKVRDFTSPKAFHSVKVQGLGGDKVKPSAEVGRKFPVPITSLIANLAVKLCEVSHPTPPITFYLPTDAFVEISKLFQRRFQRLRVLYLLTGVQGQIGIHTEFDLGIDQIHSLYYIVCAYTFTCSGQHFFGCVICHDGQPVLTDTIPKDLDITDISIPISVMVIQDIALIEDELLLYFILFFERQAHRTFRKFVACLELRRTVFLLFLELWGTDTSTTLSVFNPSEESLVGDMDTDNHSIECVARYPCPVFLAAFEQLRQMRLQTETTGVFAIDTVIAFLQPQKVVMDICEIIE